MTHTIGGPRPEVFMPRTRPVRWLTVAALTVLLGCGQKPTTPPANARVKPTVAEEYRPYNPGKGRSDPVYNGPSVPLTKGR
jgi:hypothetical protein